MIDVLKLLTEKKVGVSITNRGDCQLLSDVILEVTDESLNYNTIRRLFGLAPFVKPSINTLDILAKFNGFNNYRHFVKANSNELLWLDKEKVYRLIYDSNKETIVKYVNDLHRNNDIFLDLVISIIRELIHMKRLDVVNEIFNLPRFKSLNFEYSELLFLGNSIGLLFNQNRVTDCTILLNSNFINCVYLIYVDYTTLNGFYGDYTNLVLTNIKKSEINLFAACVLQLKNYLNFLPVKSNFNNKSMPVHLHPILAGRILSIKLLALKNDDFEKVINDFMEVYLPNKKIDIQFLYELTFISILSKNFKLMNWIIVNFSKKNQHIPHYYKHHYELFHFMCMFYYKWKKDFKTLKYYEDLFQYDDLKYSYRSILDIFNIVFKYDSSEKKELLFEEYKQLTKKLSYPLFNKDYITNYFKF